VPGAHAVASVSGRAAASPVTRRVLAVAAVPAPPPLNSVPLPSRTTRAASVSRLEAATVAIHGQAFSTVFSSGPSLPAAAATNTPAAEAW
jgi:hypothetical protein